MTALRVGLVALALLGAARAADLDPVERRRAELELRRRQAELERLTERLHGYERELEAMAAASQAEPGRERPDAAVLVRSDTGREGQTLYSVEADRATLQAVLEALSAEARLELLVDGGVSHRDVASLVSVALEGVTLRGALDLLAGRFGLDYTLGDGHVVIAPPTRGGYRTAAERLRQRAQLAYQAALVRFPDHPAAARAHLVLGEHFLARQLHPQAVEQLKRLLHDYPRSSEAPGALLALGRAYTALGDTAQAGEAWRTLVAHHPKHELADDGLLALARQAEAAGRPAEAVPLLREIIRRYADGDARPEAEMLLAEVLLANNRHEAAIQRFARLLAAGLDPEAERHVRLLAGRALIAQGYPARAREALYQLMSKFPDSPEGAEAYFLLGHTYYREAKTLLAVEAYRGALAKAPESPHATESRMRLAELYGRMTLWDKAIAIYESLLAEAPPPAERRAILTALGECCCERGSYQQAQLHFERAAAGEDRAAWAAALRAGQAAVADGRPADALPFFQRVTKQASDKRLVAQGYEALGDSYRRLARYADALAAYQAAAELAPEPKPAKETANHAPTSP